MREKQTTTQLMTCTLRHGGHVGGILNKIISLTTFVCGINMAAKPLSSESQGIGWKSSIEKLRIY